MTTQLFTRLEAITRLRRLAGEMREAEGMRGGRVEIGLRTHPHATKTRPKRSEAMVSRKYAKVDDLDSFWSIQEGSKLDAVKTIGAVVHLYISSPGVEGQLESIWTVWLGTEDQPEAVVRRNGKLVKEEVA